MHVDELETLRLLLLELGLAYLKLSIDSSDLTLLLIKDTRKLLLKLSLSLLLILQHLLLQLLLLLVNVFDLLVEHFNVQLELLFYLNMITHVSFILLQLLFVLFGRELNRFEC